MVYRDGDANSQKVFDTGLGETIAPKSNVNTMPYFVGGALSYQGVIPGRDKTHRFGGGKSRDLSRYIPRQDGRDGDWMRANNRSTKALARHNARCAIHHQAERKS